MKNEIYTNAGVQKRIRTLIVDDSAVFRSAVGRLLDCLPHVEVVGIAEDGGYALALVASLQPDLVLIDMEMPRLNGLQATREIRAGFPDVRVIMMTLHDSEQWKAAGIASGADRFIPKHCLDDELPGAIAQLFPGRAGGTEGERP
ncbi:MAG: response regulator transcription factor [Verrucomicrobia bacterium]|nr:response regulator transcription factor [Verrucomicrobiota bacterium]